MSTTMTIRALVASDAAACAALRREMLADAPWAFSASAESDPGVDELAVSKRLADATQATIGAFDREGMLLGVAGLFREPRPKQSHRVTLWGVYVTPRARGQRLARRIIERAIETARSWPGVDSIALGCSERSHAAMKTYTALGFVAWGREPAAVVVNGTAFDEVHMVLFLSAAAQVSPYAPS
jgi:RimJ/RimL family protein N-acetyltransferase